MEGEEGRNCRLGKRSSFRGRGTPSSDQGWCFSLSSTSLCWHRLQSSHLLQELDIASDILAEYVSLFLTTAQMTMGHFCPSALSGGGHDLGFVVWSFVLQLACEVVADLGSAIVVTRVSPFNVHRLLNLPRVLRLSLLCITFMVAASNTSIREECLRCSVFDPEVCR